MTNLLSEGEKFLKTFSIMFALLVFLFWILGISLGYFFTKTTNSPSEVKKFDIYINK